MIEFLVVVVGVKSHETGKLVTFTNPRPDGESNAPFTMSFTYEALTNTNTDFRVGDKLIMSIQTQT